MLSKRLTSHKKVLIAILLLIILLLAFALRVHNLRAPGMAMDREYRSALIARAFYFETSSSVPEWRRAAASASKERAGVLEPPVTEFLVSLIYRLANGEGLWMARLLTSGFWILGGVFLFMIATRILSTEASLLSTAYYLFAPFGVLASRTFFPEPLMIMMFLCGLFFIIRHHDYPTLGTLFLAAITSGTAVLIKPLVLFPLLGAFYALAISRKTKKSPEWRVKNQGGLEELKSKGLLANFGMISRTNRAFARAADLKSIVGVDEILFGTFCLLPAILYYGYYGFIIDMPENQEQARVLPQLLLTLEFWRRLLLTASDAVGPIALVAGLVGLPLLSKGMPRTLLTGLWIGYVIFCIVFTNHVRFAGYYHLQLMIIVALSFGPVIALVMKQLSQSADHWYWWMPAITALTIMIFLSVREVRSNLAAHQLQESIEGAQQVGKMVNHSSKTVFVAQQYGLPLEYYGELSGSYWPRSLSDRERALGIGSPRSVGDRLEKLGFTPEYFVITDMQEFENYHQDLKVFLQDHCRLVEESDQYIIYDSCTR